MKTHKSAFATMHSPASLALTGLSELGLLQFCRQKFRLGVIGAMLAWALNSQGAEYAGWAVGMPSAAGLPTILRSIDSGASWTRQATNGQVVTMPMYGVTAVDPQTAWVVGESDGYATIYHTTNGGLIWNRMGSAAQVPNVGLQKVATFGDNRIWAVGIGAILHSRDGGATWTNQVPAGYATNQFQGIASPDGVNVWVTGNSVGGYATILRSTNGGTSWIRQSGSTNDVQLLQRILDISAVNSNNAWAIGADNPGANGWYVLSTTNGGVTWTQQSHGNYDGNGIHAVDASTIWAVTDNNTTWSTNGGATWNVTSSQPYTMGISAVDAQQAWAVSAQMTGGIGAIQWTTNGGVTWASQTQVDGESIPALFTVSFASTPIGWPLLSVTQTSPLQATLSWPTNTAGFVLETTLVLPASTWMTVTNLPVIGSNSLFNVVLATTNAQQFFRLHLPKNE